MNPDEYSLKLTRWQFFATLTFKREKMLERHRVTMFFTLMRKSANFFRVHFPRLKWVLRMERGEIGARLHFHVLIAGLPDSALTERTCFALMKTWESIGGGMARVRVWEPGFDAVAYILKGESPTGANFYESSKFGSKACEVMLSKSLLRISRGAASKAGQDYIKHGAQRAK